MTDDALIGSVPPPLLHVMTYNIRRRIPHLGRHSPDRWRRRKPLLQALLAREQPALLGTQETMPDQADAVLDGLGERYRTIGHGRRPGLDGERNAVFYDSERLELLNWRQLALSDTPEVPGSRGWGNHVPRIVVCAEFTDLATGAEFLHLNTHFDHRSVKARVRSARAIRELAAASTLPVLVTGDFNTDAGTGPHDQITLARLHDVWATTPKRLTADWGTFPNYRQPKSGRKRIDWLLATDDVVVIEAGINTARAGGWPSDHTPVQAVLRIPASE